jgi:hypothetical protein
MYLTGTRAEMLAVRAALAQAEGLPRRGVVYLDGVERPDLTAKIVPASYAPGAPGWTDQVCDVPIEAGAQAALEVPPEAERHLGKRVGSVDIPARSTMRVTEALPAALIAKVRERRGQDADGNPLPLADRDVRTPLRGGR